MTRRAEDEGITLIEVIVYIVVSGLLLAGLAAMFVNGWNEQTKASERDRATGWANVISMSLAEVRNAAQVTEVSVPAGDGVVAALVGTSGVIDECRAWIIAPSGDILYRTWAPGESSTLATAAGWGALFRHDDARGDTASGTLSYDATLRTLSADLSVQASGQTVEINNTVTAAAVVEGTGSCLIP